MTARLSPELEQRLVRASRFPEPTDPPGLQPEDVQEVADLGLRGSGWDRVSGPRLSPDQISLTPQQVTHILDGDGRGGGHLSGVGRPRKSEFPPDWDRDRIVGTALSIARNLSGQPDLQRGNKYDAWMIEDVRDGIRIRAIVDVEGHLITAIPLDGPGVVRNPR